MQSFQSDLKWASQALLGGLKIEPTLKRDVEEYPDRYQYERVERLGVSQKGIFAALKRLGVTYKKSLNHPKADPENALHFAKKSMNTRKMPVKLSS